MNHLLSAFLLVLLCLTPSMADPRGDFVGLWWVSHGDGAPLRLRLYPDGSAWSDFPANNPGSWKVTKGQAVCLWADDWKEVLSAGPEGYVKFGFKPGRKVTESPSNVTKAYRASHFPDGWYGVPAP